MATPSQNGQPPAVDTGNMHLSEVPASLSTAIVQVSGGQKAVATVRTSSATVTVFLSRADLTVWRDQLSTVIGRMNGIILPPGP
jgi:hypothetical protein